MTEQEVRDLCAKHMQPLMKDIGISADITIYTHYELIDSDTPTVVMSVDLHRCETYRIVDLWMYFSNIDSEERFIRSLTHELLHIQLASFEIFKQTWECLLPKKQRTSFTEMYKYVLERTVQGLQIGLFEGKFKDYITTKIVPDAPTAE